MPIKTRLRKLIDSLTFCIQTCSWQRQGALEFSEKNLFKSLNSSKVIHTIEKFDKFPEEEFLA